MMAEYDLTTRYCQYLDRHLTFPLMEFLYNKENYLNVLWGKLAAEILTLNWNAALEDLIRLRDYIDANTTFNHIQLLQQRSWLIHWSVLIYFNHARGTELILDAFLQKPLYLNAIQTVCPYILRYLTVAAIISDRRDAIKDLRNVVHQVAYNYRDPITEFLECLYINYDFDAARLKLQECQIAIMYDFFIERYLNQFIENARLLLFEIFCRIHQCVSLKMVADKLNMTLEDAECWIVKLINNARLNAKIDTKLGHVIMTGSQYHCNLPYQQLREKIESLAERCKHLTHLLERYTEKNKNEWKYHSCS